MTTPGRHAQSGRGHSCDERCAHTVDVGYVHVLTGDGKCRDDCPHPDHKPSPTCHWRPMRDQPGRTTSSNEGTEMSGCRHTEHAVRGDGRYGRSFPLGGPDAGVWDRCDQPEPRSLMALAGRGRGDQRREKTERRNTP